MRCDTATYFSVVCPRCGFVIAAFEEIRGYIYILSNPLMPDIVKIGQTERDLEERIEELSNPTGVGARFQAEACFPVGDPIVAEGDVHRALNAFRVSPNREFFRISVQEASAVISRIISRPSIDFDAQRERAMQLKAAKSSFRKRIKNEPQRNGAVLGGFGSSEHEKKG